MQSAPNLLFPIEDAPNYLSPISAPKIANLMTLMCVIASMAEP